MVLVVCGLGVDLGGLWVSGFGWLVEDARGTPCLGFGVVRFPCLLRFLWGWYNIVSWVWVWVYCGLVIDFVWVGCLVDLSWWVGVRVIWILGLSIWGSRCG